MEADFTGFVEFTSNSSAMSEESPVVSRHVVETSALRYSAREGLEARVGIAMLSLLLAELATGSTSVTPPIEAERLKPLAEFAGSLKGEQKEQLVWLIRGLSYGLRALPARQQQGLPALETSWFDKVLVVEWLHPERRVMFTISPDPKRSRWVHVDKRTAPLGSSGALRQADLGRLVAAMAH